jgi:hypothetical protein
MIEIWFEVWAILTVILTVLYLIATLVGGQYGPSSLGLGKTQSLISALILGPVAATVATALTLVVHWIVVIEAH